MLRENVGNLLIGAYISQVNFVGVKSLIEPIEVNAMGPSDMSQSLGSLFQDYFDRGLVVFANS